MKKHDAFEVVRNQGWLSKQPAAFRTRLLSDASLRTLEPGQAVFEAGDPIHSLIGLAAGSFEVSLDHPQLHQQLLHIARPGAWYGQRAAYGGDQPRTVSMRARTSSSVIVIPRQKIEAMVAQDPLCLKYFALLGELQLQECMTAIVELSQRESFSKVCTRLLSLGLSYGKSGKATAIEIPVTHDEFAGLCGISRKTLSRALNELKRLRAIDVHYRAITILDLKTLSAIAAGEKLPRPAASLAAE